MSWICWIFGHDMYPDMILDPSAEDLRRGMYPGLLECRRCRHEIIIEVPRYLLVGDAGARGPWEVYFCRECDSGPWDLEDEDPEYPGLCYDCLERGR